MTHWFSSIIASTGISIVRDLRSSGTGFVQCGDHLVRLPPSSGEGTRSQLPCIARRRTELCPTSVATFTAHFAASTFLKNLAMSVSERPQFPVTIDVTPMRRKFSATGKPAMSSEWVCNAYVKGKQGVAKPVDCV